MAPIPGYFPGMGPIRGFNAPEPEAPPEVVHGSSANPAHGQWGEAAQPYSWQSQLTNYSGHTGPYGLENGLLGDENAMQGEPAGQLGHDPYGDLTPYRGHAAPMTRTLSGPLPSQYDAVNQQLVQAAEIRSTDLGASRKFTLTEVGDAQQDHWQGIWDVSTEPTKYPQPGSDPAHGASMFGFGTNDRPVNANRKVNLFGFGNGHHHRRFAIGSIPGNYMWMKPGGRAMIKTLAGPARPAVGANSPFEGDDLGASFGIQGAVLVDVPSEYQPPPSPQVAAPVNYDEPAPSVPLW
jgi:hypothetical protein